MSQKALGKELGCCFQQVSFYESGYTKPSLEVLLRLCLIFGIKLDRLVTIHYEGVKT